MWGEIENHCTEHKLSRSEAIRNIIESFYS
nr:MULTISPECIES: hypothetical protein [unclassified Paenibacillus]